MARATNPISQRVRRIIQNEAKTIVLNCVRNTPLEDLHAGIFPSSETGDYSDVKVVSPYGEIPWNDLGRISDEEMKELIIHIVDAVYTYLWAIQTDTNILLTRPPDHWNTPRLQRKMLFTREDLDAMIADMKAERRADQP